MLPELCITILHYYNTDGMLTQHGARDTFLSGLGVNSTYGQFLPALCWHLFLQGAV